MLFRSLVLALLLLGPFLVQPLEGSLVSGQDISTVSLGTVPRGVAVDSHSGTIYVVLYLNGTTIALDARTLGTVAKIPTQSPYTVAVDPATGFAYVSKGEGGSIAVIDGSTNSVVDTVVGAGTPYSLAIDEAHDLVFAADTSESSLWVVNGSTNVVFQRIPMGSTSALAVDPSAGEAFVGNLSSNYGSGTIEVVSTSSLSIVRTVQLPFAPANFAVDPSTRTLYVTSSSASGVNFLAINDQTFQTLYSLRLGESPNAVAVASPDVYVSDVGTNRLYELDGSTGKVLFNSTGDSVASFAGITAMAFDQNTSALYITENDVTDLIVLGHGSVSLPMSAYLLLATPAVASGLAGFLAILYLRRRARSKAKSSEGINGSEASNRT